MSRINIYIPSIIFLFLSVLFSCSVGSKNLKAEPILYRTDFEVQYRLMHLGADSSSLHLFVESDDYELAYIAYASTQKKIVLAEQTVLISGKQNQFYESKFKIREQEYYVELFIKDRDQNRVFRDAFMTSKLASFSHLQISSDNEPLVRSYTTINKEVNLYHPLQSTVWVKYFGREFKSAKPPFSDKGYKFNPRQNITQLVEVPSGGTIKLEGEGLYFIQADTNSLDGFYLNVFETRYPRISSSEQMIESTRYITKRTEFDKMITSNKQKEAIDKFWLSRAKDKDFAKDLIKTYYTRIQIANRDFTTYKEGWKTDRGMLYIIFGPPNQIKKTIDGEEWRYASSGKRNEVRYEFKKVNGQTLLFRSDYYKRPWDVEVYEWRKGILNE